MHSTTGAEYVITSGSNGATVAVVDVHATKYVLASRTPAVDIFGDSFVTENLDGSLALGRLGDQPPAHLLRANMPLSPLAPARSASISPDGRYLALSARIRGAVWDLATGKQIFLVRGFRSSWSAPDGKLLAEFTQSDKDHPPAIGELTPEPRFARNMTYKLPDQAHLENNFLLEWKSPNKKAWTLTAFSVADLAVKWTRQFPDGRPGYTTNTGDTDFILSDLLQSPAAKEKLRTSPTLKDQADAVKQKAAGRLIEVVNAEDGTARAEVIVEVPLTYEGVDGFIRLGDLLYLSTGDNRIIVYSLKTGVQLRQLYGPSSPPTPPPRPSASPTAATKLSFPTRPAPSSCISPSAAPSASLSFASMGPSSSSSPPTSVSAVTPSQPGSSKTRHTSPPLRRFNKSRQ